MQKRGNTVAMTRHAIADARMENKSQPVKEAGNSRCHAPPRESIVAEYRGYWFYNDERDQNLLSTYTWLVEPLAIESERVVLLQGGLNFQIEHHLFPRICHIHYRRLAPLVEMTCREFGVNYEQHKSFSAAVMSRLRWLRRMGIE